MKQSEGNIFQSRMQVLKYLASKYPKWVGTTELQKVIGRNIRTVQRMMSELRNNGYVDSDGAKPSGYRIKPEAYKDFWRLYENTRPQRI